MPDQTSGQQQDGNATGDGTGQAPTGPANAGIQFSPEQQAHVDGLITDRLKRAQVKWEADQKASSDKAAATANATKLAEEKRFQELAEKAAQERDTAITERDNERAQVRQYHLRESFRVAAATMKLKWATDAASADAFALVAGDVGKLDVVDGKVTGMDDVLATLQKARPYLFVKPEQSGSYNAAEGRGAGIPPDDAARKADIAKRFRIS